MIMDQIRLTIQDIVNKEFKKSMRGYNEEEVDRFLDTIIEDYEHFQQKIDKLTNEIERLKRQGPSREQPRANQTQPSTVNYDILKRISNLEKAVFGPKVSDEGS